MNNSFHLRAIAVFAVAAFLLATCEVATAQLSGHTVTVTAGSETPISSAVSFPVTSGIIEYPSGGGGDGEISFSTTISGNSAAGATLTFDIGIDSFGDIGDPQTATLPSYSFSGLTFSGAQVLDSVTFGSQSTTGSVSSNPWGAGAVIGHTSGDNFFTITATDNFTAPDDGSFANTSQAIFNLTFAGSNANPVADAGVPYAFDSTSVGGITLDGSGSTDDGAITAYDWDSNDNGTYNNASGAMPSISLSQTALTQPGDTADVNLRVTDDGTPALTGTDSTTVTYNNTAPTANAGGDLTFDASEAAQTANIAANDDDFAANAEKPGFEQLTYTFNGNTTTGQTSAVSTSESVSFDDAVNAGMVNTTTPGSLSLNVSDNNQGTAATASDSLIVSYDNADPTISGASATPTTGGTDVSASISDADLDVSGVYDDFEVVTYSFNSESDGSGTQFGPTGTLENDMHSSLETVMQFIPDTFTGDSVFLLVNDNAGTGNAPFFQEISLLQNIPEPTTIAIWTMLGLALGAFALRRRRK